MSFQLNQVRWQWKPFAELSLQELAAIYQLRMQVFVVEQNCPYQDIDGKDDQAIHLMAWDGEKLIATLRCFPQYKDYGHRASLGRICSHLDYRRFGVGRELVKRGVEYIDEHLKSETQIGAQFYLKRFYESFGFEQCSDIYDEDGIDHILMLRQAVTG